MNEKEEKTIIKPENEKEVLTIGWGTAINPQTKDTILENHGWGG